MRRTMSITSALLLLLGTARTFAADNPLLLDKRLLTRFYRPATLAAPAARTGWVQPDRAPFPWAIPG